MHLQNFSNRMENQASISSAVAAAAVPRTCKVSTHLPTVAKRVAFLSDLPDDILLKCAPRTKLFTLSFSLLCVAAPTPAPQVCLFCLHPVSVPLLSPASACAPLPLQTICGSRCLFKYGATSNLSHLRRSSRFKLIVTSLTLHINRWTDACPQLYRITWGKWSVALDWLQWARSMGHPSSLSGRVHKGEAIASMSILAVLCEVAPPCIIETLSTLAAPLSVQAFLRGDDAILVSHCLPCLAAMATGKILTQPLALNSRH